MNYVYMNDHIWTPHGYIIYETNMFIPYMSVSYMSDHISMSVYDYPYMISIHIWLPYMIWVNSRIWLIPYMMIIYGLVWMFIWSMFIYDSVYKFWNVHIWSMFIYGRLIYGWCSYMNMVNEPYMETKNYGEKNSVYD